jgi:hypothetical protein
MPRQDTDKSGKWMVRQFREILGGAKMGIDSPLIREMIAENTQNTILRVLRRRFGSVPLEVEGQLRKVVREKKLGTLIDEAVDCPDLEAFRARLLSL